MTIPPQAASGRSTGAGEARTRSLSRDRVLKAALHLVDAEGLEALSMRRLGAELRVEAMSLYHYFPSKDALLDGVAKELWAEVRVSDEAADWQAAVQSTASSLRETAHRHPRAYPLLLARGVLSESALQVFDALLQWFREAGFHEAKAAEALRTVLSYTMGYASVELTCCLGQPDLTTQRCTLADVGPEFAEVARALAECDPDAQFHLGLDAILSGLESRPQR